MRRAPSYKVTASTAAAAFAYILVWLINETTTLVIPASVEFAVTVLVVFIAGYFLKEKLPSPSTLDHLIEQGWTPPDA